MKGGSCGCKKAAEWLPTSGWIGPVGRNLTLANLCRRCGLGSGKLGPGATSKGGGKLSQTDQRGRGQRPPSVFPVKKEGPQYVNRAEGPLPSGVKFRTTGEGWGAARDGANDIWGGGLGVDRDRKKLELSHLAGRRASGT